MAANAPAAGADNDSLGGKAARGVAWFGAQAVVLKLVNLFGVLALAWLVLPRSFGSVGLAWTIANFATLIQAAGIRDVLIHRGRRFDRWAPAGFRLAMTLGLGAMALVLVTAPLAAHLYGDPTVTGLLAIIAIQFPINAIATIPEAKLNVDLRFRFLAGVAMTHGLLITVLTVLLAWLGFGPYSFVIPFPVAAAVRAVALGWGYERRRSGPVRPARNGLWRRLVGTNLTFFISSVLLMVTWQADYVVLGILYDEEVVGHYYWAFNLSTQALQLFAVNAANVLFPSLAQLQAAPDRQLLSFVRAARVLGLLAGLACVLQAVLADAAIRLLFKQQWWPAIPIVQFLSVGWVPMTAKLLAESLLRAQGRFGTMLGTSILSAGMFVPLATCGAVFGAATGTAAAVAVYAVLVAPLTVFLSVRDLGGGWRHTASVLLPTAAAAALALAAAWAAWRVGGNSALTRLAFAPALATATYLVAAYLLARDASAEFAQRMAALLPLPHRRATT